MKILLLTLSILVIPTAFADEILYLGDSHSHILSQNSKPGHQRFGNVFIDGFAARGTAVSYYAACGSGPKDWVKGGSTQCGYTAFSNDQFVSVTKSSFPSVSTLFDPDKHTSIVLNFGDNMFDWKTVGGKRVAEFNQNYFDSGMEAFLKLLTGITPDNCVWIGPTYHIEGKYYRKTNGAVDQLYGRLEKVLNKKCSIIDSRSLVIATDPSDGLHHVNSDSQVWAIGVLNLLL